MRRIPRAADLGRAALITALAAAQAHASVGSEVFGWEEVLRYAMCALAVAAATTGIGIVAAIAACIFNELFD